MQMNFGIRNYKDNSIAFIEPAHMGPTYAFTPEDFSHFGYSDGADKEEEYSSFLWDAQHLRYA